MSKILENYPALATATGQAPVLAIIGNQGKMGAMLQKRWSDVGFTVHGVDRRVGADGQLAFVTQDVADCLAPAQVVVLCVLAPHMDTLMQQLAPLLQPEQCLLDICSVKMLPLQSMERYFSGPIIGTHPLFGAEPEGDGNKVALVPTHSAKAQHIACCQALFACLGFACFITSAEEHDRAVALIQGLNFVTSAAYFASLAQHKTILPFVTPSLKRRIEAVRSLLTDDAKLFTGFAAENPMMSNAVQEFRHYLDLADSDSLADVVQEAHWWFAARDG